MQSPTFERERSREGKREREEGEDAPVRSVSDFVFCFILQYLQI